MSYVTVEEGYTVVRGSVAHAVVVIERIAIALERIAEALEGARDDETGRIRVDAREST